jgi:hypothetical protein
MAFGIDIDFNAQVGKLSSQVDKISQDLGRFEKKAEQVTSKINSSFQTLGAGLSVAAFTSFVKNGIDAADALNDLSDRTGVSVENLSKFKLAIELGDTTTEAFASSLNKLSINIAKNQESFAALGINAKDPLEAFIQLADVFSSIEDPQTRAAVGAKALGKAYAEVAPLLSMTGDELRELARKGEGLTGITTEQARLSGEFNDQLSVLSKTLQGLQVQFGLGIIEPLIRTSKLFSENIEKTGILRGSWLGLLDTFKESVGLKTGLEGEIDVIDRRINKTRESLKDLQGGAGFGSQILPAKEKELNDLLNQRFELVKKISEERSKSLPAQSTQQAAPTPEAITGFIGTQKPETEKTKEQTTAEKQRQEILREGLRLTEQMRTPVEKLAEEQAKYKSLLDSGAISIGTYTRAMQAANDATLNLIGANEELSSSEQFRQKSEADSIKIRLEQQRLDIINQRVTPDNEKPFQNLQPQTPQIDESGIKAQLEKAVNNPEQPLKMKIQIDAETLTKNLTSAVDLAQQQIQPIVIPVAYEIIDDGTGQSGNVAQQLNRQALSRGRR